MDLIFVEMLPYTRVGTRSYKSIYWANIYRDGEWMEFKWEDFSSPTWQWSKHGLRGAWSLRIYRLYGTHGAVDDKTSTIFRRRNQRLVEKMQKIVGHSHQNEPATRKLTEYKKMRTPRTYFGATCWSEVEQHVLGVADF